MYMNDNTIEVSVIIPNYNGGKYLKGCIDSLLRQTFTKYKIIVVDNGSEDGSYDILTQNYPNIQLIRLDSNYGFSIAVNEGIKKSDTKYIALLNNDTELDKDWLLNLIQCMEKDERIFSCCSKMIQYYDRYKIDDAGDQYTILGWAYKRGDNQKIDKYVKSSKVFSSCAGAAIYRKSILDEIGLFDENFFAYMEDVDISYRAKIYGYKNVYCSNARVYHIGSATSGSKYNSFKVYLAARNNVYVIYKNMPILQFIINSPFLLVGFLTKMLFFFSIGYGKSYIKGFTDAFKNLKNIRRVHHSYKFFFNYVGIEYEMIINTIKYVLSKIKIL